MNTNTESVNLEDGCGQNFNVKRVSPGILAAITKELLLPKVPRGRQEYLLVLRATVYTAKPETVKAIPAPVKFARKLAGLKLTQLFQQQRKFAREASKAKHLLLKMSGFSRVRTQVAAAQDLALAALKQVTAEIKARQLAATGKLAEAN